MQELLQHLFGFIGICTVLKWLINLYGLTIKKEPEISTTDQSIKLTTKNIKNECPECSSPLSAMRSTCLKECTSCKYKIEWYLSEGQLPLVANNRMVKRNETT